MKVPPPISLCFVLWLAGTAFADTVVYIDEFTSSANWTSDLPPGGLISNFNTGGGSDRRFRFRSGNGSMSSTLPERWASIYKTSALTATGEYDPVLDNSTLPVQWSFTYNNSFGSSSSTSLSGAADDAYDAHGFVVGATSADFQNAGNGYAVVVAAGPDGGTQDTLQFIKYSGGLAGTTTTLLAWSNADNSDTGLEDVGNSAVAVSLIFDPASSQWTLQGSAGHPGGYNENFVDPLSVSYTTADTKSIVDSAYTGTSLGNIGFFTSVDDDQPQNYLDHLTVQTVPEPSTLMLIVAALAGLTVYRRK
ncbi:PEP-CTERM sorting domain-containing protein [Kiritimatiellaeota bacterium B1221]|nr:PEP-CTERM sorting domain-containing protein [Kiritimatiellaeota bacterium B1221]